jgi:hypothetical protein
MVLLCANVFEDQIWFKYFWIVFVVVRISEASVYASGGTLMPFEARPIHRDSRGSRERLQLASKSCGLREPFTRQSPDIASLSAICSPNPAARLLSSRPHVCP